MPDYEAAPLRAVLPTIMAPLTGNPLDRADNQRGDASGLAAMAASPEARALPLWRGKPLIALDEAGAARLGWTAMATAPADAELFFLGLEHGAPRFAFCLTHDEEEDALAQIGSADRLRFIDLRSIARDLSGGDAAIVAEAKSLSDWRAGHPNCSKCGAPTQLAQGGWRTDCAVCGAKHFPRTDPVVIMLATRRGADGVDRVILGRQPNWPPGLFSLLAGYIEPGESVEEAARREMLEESGAAAGEVRYLASQPWPFPSTLMIGVWAEVLTDELKPDLTELEDCLWATRAEMRSVLAGEKRSIRGQVVAYEEWMAPRVDAIARTLVDAWAHGRLDAMCGAEIAS